MACQFHWQGRMLWGIQASARHILTFTNRIFPFLSPLLQRVALTPSSFLAGVQPGQYHLSMQRQRAVFPDTESPLAMTLKPLSYEQSHKRTQMATDPRSCCCMLNRKGLQQKTKLRAAGIINAKTEAITEKTTFFSALEVSESAAHKHSPQQRLHCRSPASIVTLLPHLRGTLLSIKMNLLLSSLFR